MSWILYPVSWEMAHSEWIDSKVFDGNLVTFDNGSNHYWVFDIERITNPAQLPYWELRRHFSVNQETEELVAGKSFPFLGNAPKK